MRPSKSIRLILTLFLLLLQLQPDALAQSRFSSKKKSSPHSVDEKRLISRDEAIRQMNLKLEDQGSGLTQAERRMIQRLRNKPKDEEPLDAGKKTGEHADAAAVPDPASALAPDLPYADLSSLSSLNINPDEALLQTQVLPASNIQDITSAVTTSSVPSLIRSNDPYYDYMWWHQAVHAREAWEFGTGEGVVVAVVDTGVDILHEDLTRNIWINEGEINGDGIDNDNNGYVDDYYGWNFVSNTNNILDDNGHGTHVSGIIAATADNNIGIAGIAPNSKILPVKVANSRGGATLEDILAGLRYAADMGADVINVSMGELLVDDHGQLFDGLSYPTPHYVDMNGDGYIYNGEYDNQAEIDEWFEKARMIQEGFNYASSKGAVVVLAAGNDGLPVNVSAFPAAFGFWGQGNSMVVGAMNEQGARASFSNYAAIAWDSWEQRQGNRWISTNYQVPFSVGRINEARTGEWIAGAEGNRYVGYPGLGYAGVAPGEDILSLRAGGTVFGTGFGSGSYAYASGTSMAAPVAAGIAALLIGNRYMDGDLIAASRRQEGWGFTGFDYGAYDPFYRELNSQLFWANDVRQQMTSNAVDLGKEGYDLPTGYGMFDALRSMSQGYGAEGVLAWELLDEPDAQGAVGYIYAHMYEVRTASDAGFDVTAYPRMIRYQDGTAVSRVYAQEDTTADGIWNPDLVYRWIERVYKPVMPAPADGPTHYLFSDTEYGPYGQVVAYRKYEKGSMTDWDGLLLQGRVTEELLNGTTTFYDDRGEVVRERFSTGEEYVYTGFSSNRSVIEHWDPATRTRTFYDPQQVRATEQMTHENGNVTETRYDQNVPVTRVTRTSDGTVLLEEELYPNGVQRRVVDPFTGAVTEYYPSGAVSFIKTSPWDAGTMYSEDGSIRVDSYWYYEKFDPYSRNRTGTFYNNGDYRLYAQGPYSGYGEYISESYSAASGIIERFDHQGRVIYRHERETGNWFQVTTDEWDGTVTTRRSDGAMTRVASDGSLLYSRQADGSWFQMGALGLEATYDAMTDAYSVYRYTTLDQLLYGSGSAWTSYVVPQYRLESVVTTVAGHEVRSETYYANGTRHVNDLVAGTSYAVLPNGNIRTADPTDGYEFRIENTYGQLIGRAFSDGSGYLIENGVQVHRDASGQVRRREFANGDYEDYDMAGRLVNRRENGVNRWWVYSPDPAYYYASGYYSNDPLWTIPEYLSAEGGDGWSKTYDLLGNVLSDTSPQPMYPAQNPLDFDPLTV
jgi:subtilisin family serine protease